MASQPGAPEASKDFAGLVAKRDSFESLQTPSESSDEGSVKSTASGRLPSLRPTPQAMNISSTHIDIVSNARRPAPPPITPSALPQIMEAKMKAFHLSRQGRPALPQNSAESAPGIPIMHSPLGDLNLPPNIRPAAHNFSSAPAVPKARGGLSARRGIQLLKGLPPAATPTNGSSSTSGMDDKNGGSMFDQFSNIVDTDKGTLNFPERATIHGDGIDFSSGSNFSISLNEVDTLDELGKGNYGTVYKVRHSRPRMRRPGMGLAGNKPPSSASLPVTPSPESEINHDALATSRGGTGVIMAMKEIRLELDEAKFAAIIMELDILHRCLSPYIIDFYGAFFQEGAVYICIEYMDGGSIDKIYGDGIPENVLRKITYATTQGLRTLKDDHNIIHRDVKPTNILVNTKGQVKICDFGVSGNLVASVAKTNIGCQSYMAPERISGGGMSQAGVNSGGGTYSVQSDIWSLGLSIIECAMGRYPYPPETYNNIFSQLSAIVDGEPPDLPEEGYSPLARDFVRGCLNKIPKLRPTYSMLLQHGWLAPLSKPHVITEEDEDEDAEVIVQKSGTEDEEVAAWVKNALERKKSGLMGESKKPALHNAPLDSISPATSPG